MAKLIAYWRIEPQIGNTWVPLEGYRFTSSAAATAWITAHATLLTGYSSRVMPDCYQVDTAGI